jgi:cobalt-zinc-cadmium efflux system outer membrane protein
MDQLVASIRGKLVTNQATQEELLSAQTELWRLQSDLLMSEADVDRIQYDLNALRGSEIDAVVQPLFPPEMDSIPLTADKWMDDAKKNLPQLKKLQAQSSSYQYAASAAHRMKWPMLNLSGSYGFRTGSDLDMRTGENMPRKNMITILGTVSLPLFSGRSQSGMARNMEGMKSGSDAEYAQTLRETEARVRALHLSALHGLQSIGLYQNSIIPTSEDAYSSGLTGYKANRTSLAAVLNLALAIYRNKLALYQLQFQLAETMAQINRYAEPASRYLPDQRTGENH